MPEDNKQESSVDEDASNKEQHEVTNTDKYKIGTPDSSGITVRLFTYMFIVIFSVLAIILGYLLWTERNTTGVEVGSGSTPKLKTTEAPAPETQIHIAFVDSDGALRLLEEDGSTSVLLDAEEGVDYSLSPNGTYITKVDEDGVSVANAAEDPESFDQIFESPEENRGSSVYWYPDESKVIVSVLEVLNPEDERSGEYWVPRYSQDFITVSVDGSTETELFTYEETWASARILGINQEENVFYWAASGEGGPRETFVVADLETGEVIEDLTEEIGYNSAFTGETVFHTGLGDMNTIKATTLSSYDTTTAYTAPDYPEDEFLVEGECYKGSTINGLYSTDEAVYYSVTDAPERTTTMYRLDSSAESLYSEETARGLYPLYANEDLLVFYKGFVAHCNDLGETNPVDESDYEFYLLIDDELTAIDGPVSQQSVFGEIILAAED